MIEKATNTQLKSAFEHHMAETQNHLRRVGQVFEMHDAERKAVNCPAIDGIIEEAEEVIGEVEVEDKAVFDATLIAQHCASLLEEKLKEKKPADERLTEIAESEVNV